MTNATIKCPSCGIRHKIALFPLREKRDPNTFQLTAQQPPTGRLSSLLWFLKGNHYQPQPKRPHLIVRSEIKTTPQQILIRECKVPATEGELRELAVLYVVQKEKWSRANTERHTSLGQGKHNKIKDAFLELRFLEAISSTQYQLTPPGQRFLRHFL